MENPIPNDSAQQGCVDNTKKVVSTEQTAPPENSTSSVSTEEETSFTASEKLRMIHKLCDITFSGILIFLAFQLTNYIYGHTLINNLEDIGGVVNILGSLGLSGDVGDFDEVVDVVKALYRNGIIFCVIGLLVSGLGMFLSRQKKEK